MVLYFVQEVLEDVSRRAARARCVDAAYLRWWDGAAQPPRWRRALRARPDSSAARSLWAGAGGEVGGGEGGQQRRVMCGVSMYAVLSDC